MTRKQGHYHKETFQGIRFCIEVANISHLLETNVDPDQNNDKKLWALMDIVSGVTLSDYINQMDRKTLRLKEAVMITRQLLTIVKAMHTEGVVHRDLKPGNIMIDPKTGTLTVIDFGMTFNRSHEKSDPLDNPDQEGTSIAAEMANRFYRPPQMEIHSYNSNENAIREQRRSPKVDTSMLAALLFWMTTGMHPLHMKERHGSCFYTNRDCTILIQQSVINAVPSEYFSYIKYEKVF